MSGKFEIARSEIVANGTIEEMDLLMLQREAPLVPLRDDREFLRASVPPFLRSFFSGGGMLACMCRL